MFLVDTNVFLEILPENDPRRTHFDFYIILEKPLTLNELLERKDILIKLEV